MSGVGCGIVFANKAVLSIFNFKFVYCLTPHPHNRHDGGHVDVCGGRDLRDQEISRAMQGVCPLFSNSASDAMHGYTHCLPSTFQHWLHAVKISCLLHLELIALVVMQVAPLAAAFVGYVVFWNLSLQVNSVGFYQLSKIMVLPHCGKPLR